MATSHATLKLLRKLHLWIGVFIAPALLFFAFTGAMQTFSLHENGGRADYKPPQFLAVWAQIHKNATWQMRKPGPPKPASPGAEKPGSGQAPETKMDSKADKPAASDVPKPAPVAKWKQHLPLKIFFLLVSIGLFLSTLTGIYMAYKFNNSKVVITVLLIAGVVIPLALLPL